MRRKCLFLVNVIAICLFCVSGSKPSYRLAVPPSQSSLTGLKVFTTLAGDNQVGNVQSFAEDGVIRGKKTFETTKNNHSVLSLEGKQHILSFHSDQAVSRVKLNSIHLGNSEAYLPLPDTCLGSSYRVSTLGPEHGAAFVVLLSKGRKTNVTVTLGSDPPGTKVIFNDREYGTGQEFTVKMGPNKMQILTSKSHALDGLRLKSSQPIAVFSGNRGAEPSQSNTLIEMIPPAEMAGTKHVIALPDEAESGTVKIIKVYANTSVTLKEFKGVDTSLQEKHLKSSSQTWIYEQTNSIYLVSNKLVLVVQYIYSGETRKTAMTVIPPSAHWVNSYQLHPLTDSSDTMRHSANIVIRTKNVGGFIGTSLSNGNDMTSLIEWQPIGQSDFSFFQLDLNDKGVISLSHFDPDVKFQVILTGYGVEGGSYALPGDMATNGDKDVLVEMDEAEDTERTTKRAPLSRNRRAIFIIGGIPSESTVQTLQVFTDVVELSSPTSPWWSSSLPTSEITTTDAVTTVTANATEKVEEEDDQTTVIALGAGAATAGAAAVAATVAVVAVVKTSAAAAVAPAGAAVANTTIGATKGVTGGIAANGSAPMATGQTVGTFHSGTAANGPAVNGHTTVNMAAI